MTLMPDICATCGCPNRPGHIPAPQDAVAAAICWLTKQRTTPAPISDRIIGRKRHPEKGCRYCSMLPAEKLAVTKAGFAHEATDRRWQAWEKLPPNVQFARVCDAQEVSWLDGIPAEA